MKNLWIIILWRVMCERINLSMSLIDFINFSNLWISNWCPCRMVQKYQITQAQRNRCQDPLNFRIANKLHLIEYNIITCICFVFLVRSRPRNAMASVLHYVICVRQRLSQIHIIAFNRLWWGVHWSSSHVVRFTFRSQFTHEWVESKQII